MPRRRSVPDGATYWRVSKPFHDDHLATWPTQKTGGRWNARGAHPCLYLNNTIELARAQITRATTGQPWTVAALDPAKNAPCLVEITVPGGRYVDIATSKGIAAVKLPATYPKNEDGTTIPHSTCQPIGAALYQAREIGIQCVSAAETAPIDTHELVWFDHQSRESRPAQVGDPRGFEDWF